MKQELTSLVEEAYDKLNMVKIINRDQHEYCMAVLTSLAEQASQNGLQPLPEEMPDEIMVLIGNSFIASDVWKWFKGNFGTPPAEWWMKLKKGDKIKHDDGSIHIFDGMIALGTDTNKRKYEWILSDNCSPYTEPTALEQFMNSLTPEQRELAKGLKIEEGQGWAIKNKMSMTQNRCYMLGGLSALNLI